MPAAPASSAPVSAARVPATPALRSHRVRARVRHAWRTRVRRRWRVLRGPVVVGIGLASLILGTIVWLQVKNVTPRYNFFDSVYRAITLFGFGGAGNPHAPVAL